ncbi:hypothetical protein MKJ04_10400 [Pontibacter sp. E15-1]|uniref:hypothetical protein n=1 Tax=Pontibacter sp. E15-1 TaxID=2919918 RepID=UPI001F4F8A35|nr:hypothetical protein [Pontibacter sp. E15-1]MCJ8165254.1 hypothetical protein [Pontibacter sp. E15-1]
MIEEIWNYKVQITPIVIAILIIELPNWIRKLKKLYYVPIYFSIFPLRELNEELSFYLGEDYFLGIGSDLNDAELKRLKRKIIIESIFSTLISAVLIPAIAGFIFAFVFSNEVLLQSLVAIFIYKLIIVIMAIWNFRNHAIASRKNILLLITIYVGYIGVFFQMIRTSYNWAIPYIENKDWSGMANGLADLIFNKGIAQGLILAAVTAIIVGMFTDKEIRDENLR